MAVCWKPAWCECPDCGPLAQIAEAVPVNLAKIPWPEGTYGNYLSKKYPAGWPKGVV